MSARWSDLSPDEKWTAIEPLWKDGLSATDIAVELSAPSRDAVLGIVWRARKAGKVGTTGRKKASPKPRKPRAPKVAKVGQPKQPVYSQAEIAAANRRAEAERVKREKAAQIKSAAAGAEEWIRKNGVRRFEAGMSTELEFVQSFLTKRGVAITGVSGTWGTHFNVSTGPGRPKKVNKRGLMEIFDSYRIKEGLEPVLQQAG